MAPQLLAHLELQAQGHFGSAAGHRAPARQGPRTDPGTPDPGAPMAAPGAPRLQATHTSLTSAGCFLRITFSDVEPDRKFLEMTPEMWPRPGGLECSRGPSCQGHRERGGALGLCLPCPGLCAGHSGGSGWPGPQSGPASEARHSQPRQGPPVPPSATRLPQAPACPWGLPEAAVVVASPWWQTAPTVSSCVPVKGCTVQPEEGERLQRGTGAGLPGVVGSGSRTFQSLQILFRMLRMLLSALWLRRAWGLVSPRPHPALTLTTVPTVPRDGGGEVMAQRPGSSTPWATHSWAASLGHP